MLQHGDNCFFSINKLFVFRYIIMARDTTPDSDDSLPVDPRLRELETLNSPSRTDSAGTSQTSVCRHLSISH